MNLTETFFKEVGEVDNVKVYVILPTHMLVPNPENPEAPKWAPTAELLETPAGGRTCIAAFRAELKALADNRRGFETVLPETRTAFRYLDKAIKALNPNTGD